MIKATEIMIGDWYYDSDLHKHRKFHQLQFSEAYGDPTYELKIVPIPLTPEILEKNGFYKDWDGVIYLMGKFFRLSPMTDGIGYILNNQFSIQIYSVHELQHALRLCGLNELADNFKI